MRGTPKTTSRWRVIGLSWIVAFCGWAHAGTLLDHDGDTVVPRDAWQPRIELPPDPESRRALRERWGAIPSLPWNELALLGIQKYRLNPLRAARLLAHLHAGLHDAWALCGTAPSALRCAALAQHAAGGLLLEYFLPEETPGRHRALAVSALASLDCRETESDRAALQIGQRAAAAVIQRASTDGADRPLDAPQRPAPAPGVWRPTPPLFALNPTERTAPRWRTWLLRSGDELLPAPPLPYDSPSYVAELREVLEVSRRLTPEQKKIAEDWNLDIGTATPPGVWNRHAMQWLQARRADLASATRLLAELNLAMFDAMVACWNAKMTWWTERPITEIRERFDAAFEPHLVTPPFPGYVSGHASASGAAAEVIGHRLPDLRGEAAAMAAEAALSRLYGGIHLRSDNDEGLRLGAAVGRLALERLDARLGPMPQSTKR